MEEQAKKREEQRAKKANGAKGKTKNDSVSSSSSDENCLIDHLLKEIKDGTTLRTTGRRRSVRRRSSLNTDELKRLQDVILKSEAYHNKRRTSQMSEDDRERPTNPSLLDAKRLTSVSEEDP